MREDAWIVSTRPSRLLNELKARRPAFVVRKARLLAVACCRRIWDLLIDDRSRRAIDALERFAVGDLSPEEMAAHAREAQAVPWDFPEISSTNHAAEAAALSVQELLAHQGSSLLTRAAGAAYHAAHARGSSLHPGGRGQGWNDAIRAEEVAQADLVREIFGNVCRPVEFDPAWRTSRVVDLARAIDASRDFDGMPALGDALEEAGCDLAEILDHSRRPGLHVRGCWALDLILEPWLRPAGFG
jgi:hypothetical protein